MLVEHSKVFTLPDTKKQMTISGSLDFIQNVTDVLNILIHSPSALKILNHHVSLPQPLVVEEFKEALDLGRNTGQSVQLARKYSKNGAPISKYKWLTLLPHEFRHSYNAKFDDSHILQSLAYAVVNEADAQAIEGLIALELSDYIEKNPKQFPDAKAILSSLSGDPKIQFFKQFYEQAKGTDIEKKQQAMSTFIKEFAQHPTQEGKTFSELAYQTSLERDTTQNGWERCSKEELKQIEGCLLGKVSPEVISNEPYMRGRKKLHDESSVIRKEWPTFCQRIMDGTFYTDVISYGQGITPENLIETISPQLAHHFFKVGGIPMDLEQKKNQEHLTYDIFDAHEKVGRVDLCTLTNFQSSTYPGCPKEWDGKNVLEIEGLGISVESKDGGHGHGYGRASLQKCYEIAKQVSGGRMVVHATWGAGSFYEHCGFQGLNKGKEGIKYFDPTTDGLKALFVQGKKRPSLTLKESPKEDFQVDLDCIDMPSPSSLEKTLEKMHKQGKTVLQMRQKQQKESSQK